jgi:RNA polymerase sigma-70 factor (ECF subfamily)
VVQETGIEVPQTRRSVDEDWECFRRARGGDEEAWQALWKRYRARLAALALLITGSGTAADDVVQETFVRAMGAQIKDASGTVHGLLGTIAYRLAVKEAQRTRRHVRLERMEPPDRGASPMQQVLDTERERIIAEAIEHLGAEHRDVLLLRFYGGHGYAEMADLLDLPLGTVKSRLFYAIQSCRDILRRKGVLD